MVAWQRIGHGEVKAFPHPSVLTRGQEREVDEQCGKEQQVACLTSDLRQTPGKDSNDHTMHIIVFLISYACYLSYFSKEHHNIAGNY